MKAEVTKLNRLKLRARRQIQKHKSKSIYRKKNTMKGQYIWFVSKYL